MITKIRSGDIVRMLTGKDKNKTGKILRAFPKERKVIVEGLNLVKKHQRPRRQGQKGQVILVPRPVDVSNVMLICKNCNKPSRMGIGIIDGKKVRICKKCKGEN